MKYTIQLLLLFFISIAQAQISFKQNPDEFSTKKEQERLPMPSFTSLDQATEWADLVAIAQVDDIEYEQVRSLYTEGYAFLNVLIPYKGASKGEPIAVLAQGLDDDTCYYPDRVNEGERFLVFLKKVPDEKNNVYYGYKPFCQMQILLSELGQYILRTPLDNHVIDIDESLIEQHTFNDPHAMIDATSWTSISRDEYAEKYQCRVIETEDTLNKYTHLRYTQGVPLDKLRPLLKLKYKPRITSKQI